MAKRKRKASLTGAGALGLLVTIALLFVLVAVGSKLAEAIVGDKDKDGGDTGEGIGRGIVGAVRGAASEAYEWVIDAANGDDEGEE